MNKFLVLGSLIFAYHANAENNQVSFEEICSRMEITAEVFSYDKKGNLIEKKREYEKSSSSKPWNSIKPSQKCVIGSGWSSVWDKSEVPLSIRYDLEVTKDKKIELTIKQYAKFNDYISEDSEKKAIKEKKFDVTSMQSVLWESPLHTNPRLVVRFVPDLSFRSEPKDMEKLEISAKNIMITDQEGNVWAQNLSLRGHYVAVKTYKGSFALSYYKFPGSSLVGEASSNTMKLSDQKGHTVKLVASGQFLPDGVAGNVYGVFFDKRTSHFGSVKSNTTDKESDFIRELKNNYF
ncbi:MAG: hypothetical protein H6618_09605 [Deltaproteobacteria bacterium]|nr:hypothetical protein [Deltaproteobacteria bacterium]